MRRMRTDYVRRTLVRVTVYTSAYSGMNSMFLWIVTEWSNLPLRHFLSGSNQLFLLIQNIYTIDIYHVYIELN